MKLLLDTHLVLWLALKPERLTAAERALLADTRHETLVSAISIWELRLKWQSIFVPGERKGPADPSIVLHILRELGLPVIDLAAETAATAPEIAVIHKDPFDELLIVQTQLLSARLLTRDAKLLEHPLALGAG